MRACVCSSSAVCGLSGVQRKMRDFNLRKHSSCGTTLRIIAGGTRGVTRFFFFDFFCSYATRKLQNTFKLRCYLSIYKISGSAAGGPAAPLPQAAQLAGA